MLVKYIISTCGALASARTRAVIDEQNPCSEVLSVPACRQRAEPRGKERALIRPEPPLLRRESMTRYVYFDSLLMRSLGGMNLMWQNRGFIVHIAGIGARWPVHRGPVADCAEKACAWGFSLVSHHQRSPCPSGR